MNELIHDLIGDWHTAVHAAIKAAALFVMAVIAFRLTTRRAIAQFAPFDWVAAVAVGAIVGRTATASDASWLTGTAALVSLLLVHAGVTRLRLVPGFQRFIDPPLRVLIHDGTVDEVNLARCGMSHEDLAAVLRQAGYRSPADVHLELLESRGMVSFVGPDDRHPAPGG
ncbi:DUF421 domain-containing protein [Microlunatus ginsengisoli]